MADQRDIARERAKDALQQQAAAAAARAAAAAVATEPPPLSEPAPLAAPEPEEQAEQTAPVLETPPPMPVPDPASGDTEGSYTITITGTTETDADDDPSSDTISASDGVGYSVDLKFPESQQDETESGPLDSEEALPAEPEREEPLPPPAALPTPAAQPPLAITGDTPRLAGIDPTLPSQAADSGPVLPETAQPVFVPEVRIDPMRERLEAAAENIQLLGQSGAGLAGEVTQGRDVLRETGVAPEQRSGRPDEDLDIQYEAGGLDIFASRFAVRQAADARGVGFDTASITVDAGPTHYGDEVGRRLSAAARDGNGVAAEMVPAPRPPSGFRNEESALTDRSERHFEPPPGRPGRPELLVDRSNDDLNPDVDDWALYRTRLSLIDPPEYAREDRDVLLSEEPEPADGPQECDD